jgi:DedD protein
MAASSPAPPPAASAQPATPAAAPPGGPYVLQLGAFHEASRAESLKATMQQHGYTAYLVTTPRFTIVRIGGYADRVAATRAAATLQANTRVRALILRTSDP